MKLLAALLMVLFFPALAFAEGQCSTVHMLGSDGDYVFKDMSSGRELVTKSSDGIRKPGGHLFAKGVLLRMDGKPLEHNEFNLTTIRCEHDHDYGEGAHIVSKGIKCSSLEHMYMMRHPGEVVSLTLMRMLSICKFLRLVLPERVHGMAAQRNTLTLIYMR